MSFEGITNPFPYTGGAFDGESGLTHYRARYRDPQIGHVLRADPIGLESRGTRKNRRRMNDLRGDSG